MWYLFEGTVCPARCIWLLGIRILIANIFLKISAPLSFIKAFRMNLISAGSISLPLRNFITSFFSHINHRTGKRGGSSLVVLKYSFCVPGVRCFESTQIWNCFQEKSWLFVLCLQKLMNYGTRYPIQHYKHQYRQCRVRVFNIWCESCS